MVRYRKLFAMARSKCANLAFFTTQQKTRFADFFKSYRNVARPRRVFVIAPDAKAIAGIERLAKRLDKTLIMEGKSFADLAFLRVPISFREVAARIEAWISWTPKTGPGDPCSGHELGLGNRIRPRRISKTGRPWPRPSPINRGSRWLRSITGAS